MIARTYLFLFSLMLIFSLSCESSKKPTCREERSLDIFPSEGIGPYLLGMPEDELLGILCKGYVEHVFTPRTTKIKETTYIIDNMSFKCTNSRLEEITVWGSFSGTYLDIDTDYDKELLEIYGDVIEHEDEYRILDHSNVAFGLEDSDTGPYIRIYR